MDFDAAFITPAGAKKLKADLQRLRIEREALLSPRATPVAATAPQTRRHLDPAKLGRLDERIAALEQTLASATVVEPDPLDGRLGIGETARIRDLATRKISEYRVVGMAEAEPGAGSISYMSPIGSALLGRRVGDVIDVNTPKGPRRFELVEITVDAGR